LVLFYFIWTSEHPNGRVFYKAIILLHNITAIWYYFD